jgi:hypothetical protein
MDSTEQHPLSGHPRANIWHRLLHYIEPPGPTLPPLYMAPNVGEPEDITLCGHLIDTFHRAVSYETEKVPPEKRPDGGLWESLKREAHAEAYELLAGRDASGLATYLANGLRTPLCFGLGSGPGVFAAMSGDRCRDMTLLLLDRLAAAAEALGVLSHECPELGPEYGQHIGIACERLVELIEQKIRFSIRRPKVMGLYGIAAADGVIDNRVPDDAYCVHRLAAIREYASLEPIEIGGGFGGMALFAARAGLRRWPIVDLPVMNVVQGYFLIKCLDASQVRLFGEDKPDAVVEVLPYWEFFDRRRHFDLVFNRDSLPEIQIERAVDYLCEIEERQAALLSINQEAGAPASADAKQLNLHRIIADRGVMQCRARHPYWMRKGYVEEYYSCDRGTSSAVRDWLA